MPVPSLKLEWNPAITLVLHGDYREALNAQPSPASPQASRRSSLPEVAAMNHALLAALLIGGVARSTLLMQSCVEVGFGAHSLHDLRHSSGADSDRYVKADGRLEQVVTEW